MLEKFFVFRRNEGLTYLCPLGPGWQRANNAVRECPHVSDVARRSGRGAVSVFVRTRVPDLETSVPSDAGRGRRTRRPPAEPDTARAHARPLRGLPPMCLHIYLCTDHPFPHHQLVALPHRRRRRRGAMPMPMLQTAVLAIRAQLPDLLASTSDRSIHRSLDDGKGDARC